MIGKIERVKLREVWKHEALDFTRWLEENIDVLNDALDLTIINADREQAAGDFSVDIVGEDNAGNVVVIENQLERSDHDHLGKLLTYLTALEAKIAIWIVSEPRPEHVKAISWLNEGSSASFYLVKVEAIKIGDSPPAPLLTLITGPSEEAINAGATKKEIAERYAIRKRFWTGLLEKSRQKTKLHAGISASQYNWIGSSVGLPSGLGLNYAVRVHDAQVELYIDADRDTGEGNTAILEQLKVHQQRIEQAFGGSLDWESLEGKRACRITKKVSVGGWQDEEKWPEAQDALVDSMIALEASLRPFLGEIKTSSV
jgi:hypothetical protein